MTMLLPTTSASMPLRENVLCAWAGVLTIGFIFGAYFTETFRGAILAHFDCEEKTLFPTFEAKSGMRMGPTQVMRMEHGQIRALLDDAVDALEQANPDDFLGLADTLLIMMQQHNMKEENILYPMCDMRLGADRDTLVDTLANRLALEHAA